MSYVWKGWHAEAKAPVRTKRRTRNATPRHGTHSGYVKHYRTGEKPCEPCRKAGLAYRRRHRKIQKQNQPMHEGTRRLLEATAEAYGIAKL